MTKGMASTPDIHPVSYPKKMPPKAAKAQMRYALTVTGASIREVSAVPVRTPPPAMLMELSRQLLARILYQEVKFMLGQKEESTDCWNNIIYELCLTERSDEGSKTRIMYSVTRQQ